MRRSWMRRAGAGLAALVASGVAWGFAGPSASADPEFVNGHFNLQVAPDRDCQSLPGGICLAGDVSGRIKGRFLFSPSEVLSTVETPATAVIVTTGDALVEHKDGTLSCKHTGALQTSAGDGPFVSLCVITGGTGAWDGASGYLRITGTFTLLGGGTGTYQGKVVLP